MINRIHPLDSEHSFFLFGARGTGKTSLLKQRFGLGKGQNLWIDLLNSTDEKRFSQNPDLLSALLERTPYTRVIIDEIQKVPKLLDIVHKQREQRKHIQFILTGSSACA